AVRAVIEQVAAQGYGVVGGGLPLGNTRLPSSLEAILRSHALVHSAEGELFRQVLVSASEAAELAVTGVPARELYAQAAARLHLREAELKRPLTDLGAAVGAPWGQGQKGAPLSARLVLPGRLPCPRPLPHPAHNRVQSEDWVLHFLTGELSEIIHFQLGAVLVSARAREAYKRLPLVSRRARLHGPAEPSRRRAHRGGPRLPWRGGGRWAPCAGPTGRHQLARRPSGPATTCVCPWARWRPP